MDREIIEKIALNKCPAMWFYALQDCLSETSDEELLKIANLHNDSMIEDIAWRQALIMVMSVIPKDVDDPCQLLMDSNVNVWQSTHILVAFQPLFSSFKNTTPNCVNFFSSLLLVSCKNPP